MPYRRNYRRGYRRRPYYRRRYRRKRSNFRRGVTRVVTNLAEKKTYDTQELQSISSIPYIVDVSDVSSGTGSTSRVGNRIMLESILMRMVLTSADTTNIMRIVIFQWFTDSTTAPVWEDIMEYGVGSIGLTTTQLMSPYKMGRTQDFRVLYDRFVTLDVDDLTKTRYTFMKKGFRKTISYSSGANVGTSHIFAMITSDSGAVSHPTIEGYIRLRFTDI